MHDSASTETYTFVTMNPAPEFHPIADIFPMMSKREFKDLVSDIDANGQQVPIWTYKGLVIDGRNRYKACLKLGIAPMTLEWEGEEKDLIPFIISHNLIRRHLSESQRSAVAAKLANMVVGGKEANSANLQDCSPVSQTQAADLLNVSPRSVADAKIVLDYASPKLTAAVEQGQVAVSTAAVVVKEYEAEPEILNEIIEKEEVKAEAKKIRAAKTRAKKAEQEGVRNILGATITEVEKLSKEFQSLDVKEIGARFTSILTRLTDAYNQTT